MRRTKRNNTRLRLSPFDLGSRLIYLDYGSAIGWFAVVLAM
jgi:hypothetical protein